MTERTSPTEPAPADPERLRRHVRILVDLGRISGDIVDIDRFLDRAVLQVARAVEIDHVKIMRYRPDHADLLIVAGHGWKPGVVGSATFPINLRSPPGRALQTAEPLVIENVDEADDYVVSSVLRDHGIVSLANVPVLVDGAAWGVLEVDSTARRDFSEDTIQFMYAAAAIIGAGVQRRAPRPDHVAALARAETEALMLRELQHRVKNNFQLILSSVSIQRRRFKNEEVTQALDLIANRINAISLAHDQLSATFDLRAIETATYLKALCASIEQQMDNIAIELEADEIELSIDRAIALGLVLNELATNSAKHAFGAEGGRIRVQLQAGHGYGEAQMIVSDNGRGMRQARPEGSGLQLIALLARQFGGVVDQRSSNQGTTTTVVFPIIS